MKKRIIFFGCSILILLVFGQIMSSQSAQMREARSIPVLLYHHLLREKDLDGKKNGSIISVESFSAQMKALKDNGYTTITMDDMYNFIYNDKNLPAKSVLITFDDGYYSNYEYAYPVLKENGFKASIFIITGFISEKNSEPNKNKHQMLDKESIERSKDVFTYYSHTNRCHEMVDGVSYFTSLEKDIILKDLKSSFDKTDSNLAFAHPYGMHTSTSLEVLTELNVKLAFTTKEGVVTRSSDPYQLPRITIYPDYSLSHFIKTIREYETY